MKRTFLCKVYQYNRRLFWGMVVFSTLTIFFNLIGDEVTPFFVWGMYSEKEKTVDNYELTKVTINDSISSYYPEDRILVPPSISYYKEIKENNIDPTKVFLKRKLGNYYHYISPIVPVLFSEEKQLEKYMPWYKRSIENNTGVKVNNIKIEILKVHYNKKQKVIHDSTYLFGKWIAD